MQFLGRVTDGQGGSDRPQAVVGLRDRRVEPSHDGVAQELVDRSLLLEDGFGRRRKIAVQDPDQSLRIGLFADGREPADVGEQGRDLGQGAAQLQSIGVELADHGRAHHALEQAALPLQPSLFRQVVEHQCDAASGLVGGLQRCEVQTQIHRPALVEDGVDFEPDHSPFGLLDISDETHQVGRERR